MPKEKSMTELYRELKGPSGYSGSKEDFPKDFLSFPEEFFPSDKEYRSWKKSGGMYKKQKGGMIKARGNKLARSKPTKIC